ncbi:carboxyltransferase domain-containing protein [Clostridioides difficile]
METRYLISGDKAVVAEFGNEISEDINKKVISFMRAIEISNLKGIVTEMVPTYRSLMISYNPLEIDFDSLIENLKKNRR